MKIVLDLQALQSHSRRRGIGRYTLGLAQALAAGRGEHEMRVLLNLAMPEPEADLIDPVLRELPPSSVVNFPGLRDTHGLNPAHRERGHAAGIVYACAAAGLGADLLHIGSAFDGFSDDTLVGYARLPGSPAIATTVYDLIPLEDPGHYLPTQHQRDWYHARLEGMASSDVLLAISDYTRRVVMERLNLPPERVVAIGTDTDPGFRQLELAPEAVAALKRRYGIGERFLLHTGSPDQRKNIDIIIRAMGLLDPALRVGLQLVLVGSAPEAVQRQLRVVARQAGVDARAVVFAGQVGDGELVALYNMADAYVFPSLAEGFGLPALEAMRCGTPVLGSNRTSIPEVIGRADLLFDPTDPADLAAALTRMLGDADFRAGAVAHGLEQQARFSWTRSAALAQEAFGEAVARRRAQAQPRWRALSVTRAIEIHVPPTSAVADEAFGLLLQRGGTLGLTPNWLFDAAGPRGFETPPVHIVSAEGPDANQAQWLEEAPGTLLAPQGLDATPHFDAPALYAAFGYTALRPGGAPPVGSGAAAALRRWPQLMGVIARSAEAGEGAHWRLTSPLVPEGLTAAEPVELLGVLEERHPLARLQAATRLIRDEAPALAPQDRHALADALAALGPAPETPRLFVDVSELVRRDARSGIQRVVRSALKHIFDIVTDHRVEPVYLSGGQFRHARRFTLGFLGLDPDLLDDTPVDFRPGDTFLGLDLSPHDAPETGPILAAARRRGVRLGVVVYDLLPMLRPECFVAGASRIFGTWFETQARLADVFVCISRAVADEVMAALARLGPQRAAPAAVTWFHLGADLEASVPTTGYRPQDRAAMDLIGTRPMLLTVGTIEPRKGYGLALEAMEALWQRHDVVWTIIGKRGWLVDELIARLENHPERGKRLIWLEGPSDEVVNDLYNRADAALMPSEAEGFGLPLVEAARHKTPIIARELPVFREVAGEHALYFEGGRAQNLTAVLEQWLDLRAKGGVPMPVSAMVLSWEEATRQLVDAVFGRRPYRVWETGGAGD